MADVIITLKIMPESPDIDLDAVKEKIEQEIKTFGGEVGKVEKEPVAFGLIALNMIFVSDESKGSTEQLEENISKIQGVSSVEVTDVRRALG